MAGPAAALTIDFTDRSAWDGSNWTQTYGGGLTVTVTATGGTPNLDQNYDGGSCVAGLACGSDGIGIGDDEISDFARTGETLIISFSRQVSVAALHFLDFFSEQEVRPEDRETAEVTFSDGKGKSFTAIQPRGNGAPGYLLASLGGIGTSALSLMATPGNDARGQGDFSLAGIELTATPVPVPAGLPLVLTALGGLALARRRRGMT